MLWNRYIDDSFLVWTGTEKNYCCSFRCWMRMKFMLQIYNDRIPFLDLVIIKQTEDTLITNLYGKPTAGNTLIYATSVHPKPLIRSIPFAQYLRLRRNCGTENDFKIQANALRKRLLSRGYTRTNLKNAFNKACQRSRHSLLYNPPRPKAAKETVWFITTFSAHHSTLRSILTKHWHLLTEHNTLHKHVQPNPELVFRSAHSLRDRLTQSHYAPFCAPKLGANGTFRCGDCPRAALGS